MFIIINSEIIPKISVKRITYKYLIDLHEGSLGLKEKKLNKNIN